MKFLLITLGIVCITNANAQTKKPVTKKPSVQATKTPATKLSSIDSLSYSIGVQVADFYKNQGIEKINTAMIKRAYDDVYSGETLLINPEQFISTTKVDNFLLTDRIFISIMELRIL